jgi:hypothetical protein
VNGELILFFSEDLIAMNEKISELVQDGVSTSLVMELSRRVLDEDTASSKPIVLYEDDSANHEDLEEDSESIDQEELGLEVADEK